MRTYSLFATRFACCFENSCVFSGSVWLPKSSICVPIQKETLQESRASWQVVTPPLLGPPTGQTPAPARWQPGCKFRLLPRARGKN